MNEVKTPTVGRQVHYFPVNEPSMQHNNTTVLPATVSQVFTGLNANMHVLSMNPDCPIAVRYSVFHKSEVLDVDGNPTISYWDWPQIG